MNWCKGKGVYNKKRLYFIIIFEIMNFLIMLVGLVKGINLSEISNFYLGVFVMNLLLYLNFYWIMKIIKKEPTTVITICLAFMMLLCLLPGGYFFTSKEKTTVKTPAESRNMNRECIVMDLFSGHDVWHFLSAAGLFFLFLLLLVIDDGIAEWPRDQIRIF